MVAAHFKAFVVVLWYQELQAGGHGVNAAFEGPQIYRWSQSFFSFLFYSFLFFCRNGLKNTHRASTSTFHLCVFPRRGLTEAAKTHTWLLFFLVPGTRIFRVSPVTFLNSSGHKEAEAVSMFAELMLAINVTASSLVCLAVSGFNLSLPGSLLHVNVGAAADLLKMEIQLVPIRPADLKYLTPLPKPQGLFDHAHTHIRTHTHAHHHHQLRL